VARRDAQMVAAESKHCRVAAQMPPYAEHALPEVDFAPTPFTPCPPPFYFLRAAIR